MILTSTGFKPENGWLGNKFFKFMTLFCLSEMYNSELVIRDWIGDKIFQIDRDKIKK